MEIRAIIAIVISIAIFLAWSHFMVPKKPAEQPTAPVQEEQPVPSTVQPSRPQPVARAPEALPAPAEAAPVEEIRTIHVTNGLVEYAFSELGGRLVSCRLTAYREENKPDSPFKQLVRIEKAALAPLGLTTINGSINGLENALFEFEGWEENLDASQRERELVFRWVSPEGVAVVKRYMISPASYIFNMRVELINQAGRTIDDNLGLLLNAQHEPKEGGHYAFKGFGAYVNNELHQEKPAKLKEPKIYNGQVSWGGYENSYFLQAVVPLSKDGSVRGELLDATKDNEMVSVRYTSLPFNLAAGRSETFDFMLYFGPKVLSGLKKVGHDLERSINMGWFDVIAKPFLAFLEFCHRMVKNWGLAIILLTVGVKIVFWPLTNKSAKSMRAMQELQPQMAKIKEKFKDNPQRMNQEIMGLYKSNKVNPMGGCLPMVIQIPVFIALYRLLDYAIELRHTPFILWINDLSAPDRLFHFPFSVPFMEPPYGLPVLTLLMGASMFLQQKMTPTPGDPSQAKIMMLMPIIFTFVFINFPAGLVLYWLTNNVLSIAQQSLVNRGMKKA